MGKFYLIITFYLFIVIFPCTAQFEKNSETPSYTVEKQFISVKDGLASREVYCVAQDQHGFIWFGTKFGLNRYDGKNVKLFTTQDGLSSNIIVNLFVDAENHLIIQHGLRWAPHVSNGTTDVFDVNTFKVIPYVKAINPSKGIKNNNWIYKYIDKDVIYKIGTISGNNTNKKLNIESISRIYFMPGNKAQLVYSETEGLYYVEGNVTIKVLNHSDLFIGDQGRINYFLKDAMGNLWICMPNGVYKIKYKRNHFYSYFTNIQQSLYPWPQARGIWVDKSCDGQNTVYASIESSIFSSKNNLQQIISTPAWGILSINKRFYTFGFHLNEFDKTTLKPIRIVNLFDSFEEYSTCVFQYSDSILYVGTTASIFAYNRFTQNKSVLEKSIKQLPAIKNIYRIIKTSKGITAVAENGIYVIQNGKITDYFGHQTKDKKKYLPIASTLDIHEDKNKCLWIATNGDGLVKWDWNKIGANQTTVSYTLQDGLPSMILYRIEEDNSNNLWVSTDDGIMKFNKKTENISLFTTEDGLPHHEFNRTSSFKSADGWIYFGGMNGVVGFDPVDFNQKTEDQHVPFHIVGITKYSTDSVQVLLGSLSKSNQRIICLPSDRLIKIDFAVLDYVEGKKIYAYRINGVQNDKWIYTKESSISLGSLPYGSYIIEIKAQLADGSWLNNTIKIPIDFVSPFYLKRWFVALSLVILIILILSVIWLRSKRLKKQNVKLENVIAERTEDLKLALEDKDTLLKELHHRVKNNLQIITGLLELQKEQLTDEKAIQALNEGQIRLTSIALIHQNFYGGTNLEKISFYDFLMNLTTHSKELFENENRIIEYIIHPNEINIDIDNAIPLGLIVNELLTNSYKYIPLVQKKKSVEINLQTIDNGTYELIFKDNGPGLPSYVNLDNSQTLGLKLIRGLSQQIKGSVTYHYDQGSVFTIRFKGKSKTK
jgi:two-component sensor histidine kinase